MERILRNIRKGFEDATRRTSKVWDFLKFQKAMGGFVLLGGSALSLRINHRFSEDLDVAFTGLPLPTARLHALSRSFGEHGVAIIHTDDPAAAFEFEAAGHNVFETVGNPMGFSIAMDDLPREALPQVAPTLDRQPVAYRCTTIKKPKNATPKSPRQKTWKKKSLTSAKPAKKKSRIRRNAFGTQLLPK